jgi:hypothetical protein
MSYRASRTKNTHFWLLPDDETAFDLALSERIPSRAWECDHPGPRGLHPRHLHSSLAGATACGGRQAFLHLPFDLNQPPTPTAIDIVLQPGRPPVEASVQYLRARLENDYGGKHLDAGWLAVEWFVDGVGEQMHEVLSEQSKLVWSALAVSTRPAKIEKAQGRPISGYRIGDAALAIARDTRTPLSDGGPHRYRLR